MLDELKSRLEAELERVALEVMTAASGDSNDDLAGIDQRSRLDDHAETQARVRRLGKLLAALSKVDQSAITIDRVGFGSTVTLLDLDLGNELSYTLSAGEFIDVDAGEVSLASPIGHALLGRSEGDEVAVATPRGNRRFRILALTTLPERLGMSPVASSFSA